MTQHEIIDRILSYEAGELDEKRTVKLFQALVDTGLVWQLQGRYGRAAAAYIEAGLVTRRGRRP